MNKVKLIVEISEEMLNNPNAFPEYMFKKSILNGTLLQAELEEIKTEIEDMGWDIYKTERKVPHKYVEKERIYELLDNRIAELKGENNETDN